MNRDGKFPDNFARPATPNIFIRTNTSGNGGLWRYLDRPIPPNYNIPLGWHHSIPWANIQKGWNRLIDNKNYVAIKTWINIAGIKQISGDRKKLLVQIKNKELSLDNRTQLIDYLCWSIWNITEGPERNGIGNGGDDPGNTFDDFSYHFEYKNRCNLLKTLDDSLKLVG